MDDVDMINHSCNSNDDGFVFTGCTSTRGKCNTPSGKKKKVCVGEGRERGGRREGRERRERERDCLLAGPSSAWSCYITRTVTVTVTPIGTVSRNSFIGGIFFFF